MSKSIVLVAPPALLESRIAWRSEPGPLSLVLLTTKPWPITVRVSAGLVTSASDAVIALVPRARAVARPVLLIVATDGVADAQVTELVMSRVSPSAKVPMAVNCPVKPLGQGRVAR